MSAKLSALLALHRASNETKAAYDLLVEAGYADAAHEAHEAGERIAMALGRLVKAEAERRDLVLVADGRGRHRHADHVRARDAVSGAPRSEDDRALAELVQGEVVSRKYHRTKSKERRDRSRALGRCINAGPASKVEHGLPVGPAGRCQRCVDVHQGLKPEVSRRIA